MKLKNLSVAFLAIILFAACNKSDEYEVGKSYESAVSLKVNIPFKANKTRGVVTDASELHPIVTSIAGTVVERGGRIKIQDKGKMLAEGETNYTLNLGIAMLDGSEIIKVVLNNGLSTDLKALSIDKVQPTEDSPSIGNAVYYAEKVLGEPTGKTKDGLKEYNITTEAKPVIARLEIYNTPDFNKDLVSSMRMNFFTPIDYSINYKGEVLMTLASKSSLAKEISSDEAAELAGGNKILANHLFDADDAHGIIGFEIAKKRCYKNGAGQYATYSEGENSYFIYEAESSEGAAKKYYINKKVDSENHYYEIFISTEGFKIADVESDESTVTIPEDVKTEYFKLKINDNTYKGGNIYKLNLATSIAWDKEGGKIYDPSTTEGVEDKDKAGVDDRGTIKVEATVVPYVDENIDVEI